MVRVVNAVLVVLALCLFVACGGGRQQTGKQWYEGGTLHDKTAADWHAATPEDRLATCGDFVATAWEKKMLTPQMTEGIRGMEDMKPLAKQLAESIDKAAEANGQIKVAELASASMMLRGWMRKPSP